MQRTIALLASDEEISRRLAAAASEAKRSSNARATEARGYLKLFLESVTQADRGCDFDFLRAVEMKHRAQVVNRSRA